MEERQDERRMLADSVAAFARSSDAGERARRLGEAQPSFSREVWAQLAELGWLGILVPERASGLGLGVPEVAIVAEGLGRARLSEPFSAVAGFAASVLAAGDKPAAAEPLLAALAGGEQIIAVAWQEDPAEPDPGDAGCRIEEGPRGLSLSGRKYLVVPAEADTFVVSAASAGGIGLYAVAAAAPGLHSEPRLQVDGSRMVDLEFDRVALDEAAVIASPGVGLPALQRGLANAQVLASAELLGLSDRLLQLTIDYLGSREQFDQPLSGFQVLRHRLVDLYIQRELIRASLAPAVRVLEQTRDPMRLQQAASRAKARASDAAMLIAREAVQLHGAIGYTEEADVGIYLRRILTLSAWLGNAAWHRRRYGELARSQPEETA